MTDPAFFSIIPAVNTATKPKFITEWISTIPKIPIGNGSIIFKTDSSVNMGGKKFGKRQNISKIFLNLGQRTFGMAIRPNPHQNPITTEKKADNND
jgi:hypothetical protein